MLSPFGAMSRHTVTFAKAYRTEELERSSRSLRARVSSRRGGAPGAARARRTSS